jgi:hypothetical protein
MIPPGERRLFAIVCLTRLDPIVAGLGISIRRAYGPIWELYLQQGGAALLCLLGQRTLTVRREIDKLLQGC